VRPAALCALALVCALAPAGLAAAGPAAAGPAATDPPVRLRASLDGTPASDGTERHPIGLDPGEPLLLEVRLDNRGDEDLTVGAIRFEGRVMGLTFFAYDTRVGLDVPAHGTATRRYPLDLVGLEGQATGLIPARVVALDAGRQPVADESLVVDVQGSVRSVYGAFGLAVAGFTGLSLAGALLGLARHRLSANRWRRGVRFAWPGLGLGLFLVFTLSALRVFVPQPHRWLPIVAASTVVLLVVGYLTPTPDEADGAEEAEDAEDAEDVDDAGDAGGGRAAAAPAPAEGGA
jgi:hypothetical protein